MNYLLLIGVIILTSEMQAQESSTDANTTDDDVAPTAAASLRSIFAKLAQEFDAQKAQDSALTSKDATLSRKIDTLNSKVSSLTSKDSALTSQDSSLSSRIAKWEAINNHIVYDQGGTTDGRVRIRATGLLEVYHNGEWGTVCDDSWGSNDARVVCRQLGRSGGSKIGVTWGYQSSSSLPTLLDDVGCGGSESKITYCSHVDKGQENCGHSEDVHMKCDW